jgi:hypothetical protein
MADSQDPIEQKAQEITDIIFNELDRDCEWITGREHAVRLVEKCMADFSRGLLEAQLNEICEIILDPRHDQKYRKLWHEYTHSNQSFENYLVAVLREHFNLGGNKL